MQWKFVIEWCKDLVEEGRTPNATQAALRAGCTSAPVAGVTACRWLADPKIQAAIEERKAELAAAAGLTTETVLKLWLDIARADPGELIQIRRTCCRHCHGFGHQYQWTEAEYLKKVNECVDKGKEAPDGMGGFSFNPNAAPHPACPECGGLGIEDVYVADTRNLSPRSKLLYAGVQKTKDGIKINMRDQDAAVANLSKYLGMLIERKELSGPGGTPLAMVGLTAADLSDDQLAAFLGTEDDDKPA